MPMTMSTRSSTQQYQRPNKPQSQPLVQRTKRCSSAPDCTSAQARHEFHVCRRLVFVGIIGLICEVSQSLPVYAKPVITHKEVDDDSSALIQGLLAKSKENKERYTKERLQDYYRRNFKDYFSYEKGLGQSSNGRGVSDENQQKILKWLKDNP